MVEKSSGCLPHHAGAAQIRDHRIAGRLEGRGDAARRPKFGAREFRMSMEVLIEQNGFIEMSLDPSIYGLLPSNRGPGRLGMGRRSDPPQDQPQCRRKVFHPIRLGALSSPSQPPGTHHLVKSTF